MKKVKIRFSGMTGNFNPKDNFIVDILKKHYEIELSENPDYLIYSVNSKDYLNYQCIRIFFTPENIIPDFNICDYAIGFSNIIFDDRYIRLPLYLVDSFAVYSNDNYGGDLERALNKHLYADAYIKNKTDFCSFVYSNSKAACCRKKVFDALSNYKKVNSGGLYLNNIGGRVENKTQFQSRHRFVLAFENSSTPGYTTEKIIGAFAAGAIPIYWGDPEIEKTFNKDSFINCNRYGLDSNGNSEEAIEQILDVVKKIDKDDKLYAQYLKEPAFIDNNYPPRKQKELEQFLVNIFSQEYESAFRRNRYYWGERYERKQRIGNAFYWKLRKLIPLRDQIRKIGELFGRIKVHDKT